MMTLATAADDDASWLELQRQERETNRAGGRVFFEACRDGDAERLSDAMQFISEYTTAGWCDAFRRVASLVSVSPEITAVFTAAWISNKSIAQHFDRRGPVIRALRVLLPPYTGSDAVRLYRAVSWRERRRRSYGLSWTSDLDVAEKFATDARQVSNGGSAILEADIPAAAIISALTVDTDDYSEREFFVDCRMLEGVRVVKRYAQISHQEYLALERKSAS